MNVDDSIVVHLWSNGEAYVDAHQLSGDRPFTARGLVRRGEDAVGHGVGGLVIRGEHGYLVIQAAVRRPVRGAV